MKKEIHPKYFRTTATCACGNSFEIGSTKENVRVEVCSKCHPFYTGSKLRTVDAGGRVERFKKKFGLD
ncbi:MAG: 50S ribosomal protein L31 [Syntrophomonadaceae bacterium]|nr:50S ribosomal protein L31 [Syntrophomonadaceae bacterium]